MTVELTRRRFTVDEYHRMVDTGILTEDDHVELLDGEIVEMTPIGRSHLGHVDRLTLLFATRLGTRAIVRVQGSIPLPRIDSEPQPDLVLLRPCPDFYVRTPLQTQDVLLVIEVADTSGARDRAKMTLYARAGIAEAWVIDLPAARVEVYREPGPRGYRDVRSLSRGQRLAPAAFPDLDLAVDDILL